VQVAARTFWMARHLGIYLCRLSLAQFLWFSVEHVGCDEIRLPPTFSANAATCFTVAGTWCKMNSSVGGLRRLGHYECSTISNYSQFQRLVFILRRVNK
jgi:hypothetical protein